jgi:SAM-dependent methyltransferase
MSMEQRTIGVPGASGRTGGDSLRELVGRLAGATSALSALGAALEARAQHKAPALSEPLGAVLEALGAGQAVAELPPAALRPLLGEIRMTLLHGLARLEGGGPGWSPADPATLQAAGEVSAGFPALLQRLVPQLDGLASRLAGGTGTFLDVGVGVAALAVEMARLWPGLRVVGLDVLAPALTLARAAVERGGLQERIALREQSVQDLSDVEAFDLAWLPSVFIPPGVMTAALPRLHRALRPGGWLIVAAANPAVDPLARALGRLRTLEWGGSPWPPAQAEAALIQAGFVEVRALPGPPTALVAFVAARAPQGAQM